jgi:hypothetical protein
MYPGGIPLLVNYLQLIKIYRILSRVNQLQKPRALIVGSWLFNCLGPTTSGWLTDRFRPCALMRPGKQLHPVFADQADN